MAPDPLILLVEDDESVRSTLAVVLAHDRYRVEAVGDVASALERLAHGELPAVIVTDCNLPDADGPELRRRLASMPRTAGVPVILHSSCSEHHAPGDFVAMTRKIDGPVPLLAAIATALSSVKQP